MAVHAHPDDESSKGAATVARYVAEGVDVMVVTCTGGERGDVLNPALKDDPEVARDLAGFRRKEMARAVAILGVQHRWLGFVDSGLPEGDPLPPLPEDCFAVLDVDVAAAPLVALVRQFRPQVMVTYDENGGYPHPDHIMTHKVAMAAYEAAGDPSRYPEAGEPWEPLKLYYDRAFSLAKLTAIHEAALAEGLESPFAEWIERRMKAVEATTSGDDTSGDDSSGDDTSWGNEEEDAGAEATPAPRDRQPTTFIECGEWFEVRDRALLAHATQIDPSGWFFSLPMEFQRQVWSTEEFELGRSRIAVELPEDDLFAGVREPAVSGVRLCS
jgi:mycothiol S-conjugate amidase